ncbi:MULTISPECIES: hypothetical protein [Providencia]|uniref:hypothetical protein n=1 Tax=Providencia TaxID=586 RepID=UPI000DE7511C|nr:MULTISPECIES: hypothetical protein [Providencia]GHB90002.1 hypothetical protein GCM10007290_15170 [Providencia thailandensis]SST02844.1 Uncharacterised protein [Acinetobacter baumannii]
MSKFTFAHLIGRKAKTTEEDDEKTRKAKGRRVEDDDEEENAENDDPESEDQDEEKEGRKAKKAKSKKAEDDDDEDPDAEDDENAEGDDEDAEDDEDNKDVKKGRRAERKRCARIFGSKAAAARPDMAAHLAFNTNLSSSEAISTLKAMGGVSAPKSNRRSLDARMREEEQVRLGQDAEVAPAGSAASIVNKMTSLYNSNKGGK